jgi:hypothetical protein
MVLVSVAYGSCCVVQNSVPWIHYKTLHILRRPILPSHSVQEAQNIPQRTTASILV